MKTKNYIRNSWASVLFMLLVWMPIKGMAQANQFELVVEKTDGTELTFMITANYPVVQYYYGSENNIKSIEIQAKEGNTTVPCPEIRRLFTRALSSTVIKGDVNGDGYEDATDIEEVLKYIKGNPSDNFKIEDADVNGDGIVNIADIIMMVNIIIGI